MLLFPVVLCFALSAFGQNQNREIDSLNHVLVRAKEDTSAVAVLNVLSKNYWQIGDFDNALNAAQKALSLSQKINFKTGTANSYNRISLVYGQLGDYPEALKCSLACLKIDEEIGTRRGIANCYNNMGNIYYHSGNLPEALKNYSASLKMRQEIGDKLGIATSYNNLGNIYTTEVNYEEALKNYLASLKIAEELKDKQAQCHAHNNIGNLYENLGNYTKALDNFNSSLNIANETGDKFAISTSNIGKGEVYFSLKKNTEARECLIKGLQLAREIGGKQTLEAGYHDLAVLDSVTGNYKEAYQNALLWMEVKDSLVNEESDKQISQLKIQYETVQREKELATLKIQNELQVQKTRQGYTYILLITALSLLIFAALWFQSYKRKKRLVISDKELEKKNLELTNKDLSIEKKKAEERAKVQKEIAEQYHDIVGSKITSLLFMCENEKMSGGNGNGQANSHEFTSKVSLKLKEIAETNRSGIIALDPDTEILDSFIAKLRSDLYNLIETAGKELLFIVPVDVPKIKVEPIVKFNLSALMKEAVNNAMKYSKKNEVTIQIEMKGTCYTIGIIDHGAGIDPDKKKNNSYGIMNMKHRMENVGGTCEVISKMNEGTTVKLEGDFAFSSQLNEVNGS